MPTNMRNTQQSRALCLLKNSKRTFEQFQNSTPDDMGAAQVDIGRKADAHMTDVEAQLRTKKRRKN